MPKYVQPKTTVALEIDDGADPNKAIPLATKKIFGAHNHN